MCASSYSRHKVDMYDGSGEGAMEEQTLLERICDDGRQAWFGSEKIVCRQLNSDFVVLLDETGRVIPWAEVQELYTALSTFYEQCPLEDIVEYNRNKVHKPSDETSWEAWRRQRRAYRPGIIYLLQDTLGTLQPTKGAYKIGRTFRFNFRMRAYGMQRRQLSLVHIIQVSDVIWAETFLLRYFEHCRIHNREWFDLSSEDVAWIKTLPSF